MRSWPTATIHRRRHHARLEQAAYSTMSKSAALIDRSRIRRHSCADGVAMRSLIDPLDLRQPDERIWSSGCSCRPPLRGLATTVPTAPVSLRRTSRPAPGPIPLTWGGDRGATPAGTGVHERSDRTAAIDLHSQRKRRIRNRDRRVGFTRVWIGTGALVRLAQVGVRPVQFGDIDAM